MKNIWTNSCSLYRNNCSDNSGRSSNPFYSHERSLRMISSTQILSHVESDKNDKTSLHSLRVHQPRRRSRSIVEDEDQDTKIISAIGIHDPSESAGPDGTCNSEAADRLDVVCRTSASSGVITTCHASLSCGADAVRCSVPSACEENRQDAARLARDCPSAGFLVRYQIITRRCLACINAAEVFNVI